MDTKILYGMLAVVVVLSVVNLLLVTSGSQSVASNIIKAKEDARPANVDVVKLFDANCSDCFNIDSVLSELKSKSFKIGKEESVSPFSDRGKELANKFGITRLPTLIVSGEVKKSSIESFWKGKWELRDGSAVFKEVLPPYIDAKDNQVKGRVLVTNVLDSSCKDCADLSELTNFLKTNGVVISEEKKFEYNSADGVVAINTFGVEKIPAIIISKNVLEYSAVGEVWKSLNTTEKNGFFTVNAPSPPYRDVKSGELKGFVDVIYLKDSSCKSCYNVSANRDIIDFHSAIGKESDVDVNSTEGQELVKKYKIEKVPIVLMSPAAGEYSRLKAGWTAEAGTIESDGWFVMRNPQILGNYKDLKTNSEVVMKKEQQQPSSDMGRG